MSTQFINRKRGSELGAGNFSGSNKPVASRPSTENESKTPAPIKNYIGLPNIQCSGSFLNAIITTSSIIILPRNKLRSALFIQNVGIQDAYISLNGPAASTNNYANAMKIPPNGYIELKGPVPIDDIYGVSVAGTIQLTIFEGIML